MGICEPGCMDEHQIHVFPINHKYCRHEAGKEVRGNKGEEKKVGKDKREEEKQ